MAMATHEPGGESFRMYDGSMMAWSELLRGVQGVKRMVDFGNFFFSIVLELFVVCTLRIWIVLFWGKLGCED